jgi:hypothetical protein
MFLICSNADARVNLDLVAPQAMPHRNVGEAIANKTGICGRTFLAQGDDDPLLTMVIDLSPEYRPAKTSNELA